MAAAKSKRTKKARSGQQPLFRRGGKRRGAGRKSKKSRPGRRHARRAEFSARHPLHVVLRVEEAVQPLRRRAMYKAIREATISAARAQRIRIIHVSVQRSHIHMIVEAAGREMLARGMQGFQVACARNINRALGRRGRVFAERYYVEIITTPTQALRALTYVLCNWRHHGEDRGGEARAWLVDPYSTGAQFSHWAELERGGAALSRVGAMESRREPLRTPLEASLAEPLVVCGPRTWLLAEGWKRVGTISAWAVPGTKAAR